LKYTYQTQKIIIAGIVLIVIFILIVAIFNSNPAVSPVSTPSPASTPSPTPTPNIFQGFQTDKYYITFYGWPDNSPSGNIIAYPKSRYATKHETAGGIGTYNDPVTFASDPSRITIGKIYYLPFLAKYFVMEDYCESCRESWRKNLRHIDVWMESGPSFPKELTECQQKWTRKEEVVIINPSPHFPVDPEPLFNKQIGQCN